MKIAGIFFLVLFILLIGFLLLGVIKPKVQYEIEIEVDARVQRSWDVFFSGENLAKWITGFNSIELISGENEQVGSRYKMTLLENGKEIHIIEEVTAIKPNEFYAFNAFSGSINMTNEISFSGGGENKLMVRVKSVATGNSVLWRSVANLIRPMMKKKS